MVEKEYVNVTEAAELLGISRVTLYRWSREGKLTIYKPSKGTSRIKVSDIKKLIEHEKLYGEGE